MVEGTALFFFFIVLLLLRVPIFVALIFLGSIAYIITLGFNAWWHWMSFAPWSIMSKYHYSVIPLFLMMGQIASSGNITKELFSFVSSISKNSKGNLAISTILSCMVFGSLCGSSVATAATMTKVSYHEMYKRNYSKEIIFGTLASGGTLGVLIPPSIVLVIYAIIAEQSIAYLTFAAIIPAGLAVIGYIIAIKYYIYKNPHEVPDNNKERFFIKSFIIPISVFGLFCIMILGLYTGQFAPTEVASVGVVGVIVIVVLSGKWKYLNWLEICVDTSKTTAVIMFIFIGAEIFNTALTALNFPDELAEFVMSFDIYPKLIILFIIALLILLGCFMDGISIVLLIVPLLLPIIINLDFGMPKDNVGIWFGIIILSVVEIGLITPPIGMNLFVIRSVEPALKKVQVIKSIKYFLVSDIIRILILVLLPGIMILP